MTETASNPPFFFNSDNFVAIPREIFIHQTESVISPSESQLYQVLLFQADYQTGLWRGTVSKIIEVLPFSDKSISAWLIGLHDKKYVKSFHKQGVKGLYYVAIHGYFVRTGRYAQHQLDAWATLDPRRPVYRPFRPGAHSGSGLSPEIISGENGSPEPSPEASPEPSPVKTSDYSRYKMSINKNGGGGGGEKPAASLEDQNQPPSGKNEGQALLSDLRTIYDHHNLSGISTWNTTPAHALRTTELEQEYGRMRLLLAFDSWCCNDAFDQLETKHSNGLKFPLKKFLGQVPDYIAKSQDPFEVKRRSKAETCPLIKTMAEREADCTETV